MEDSIGLVDVSPLTVSPVKVGSSTSTRERSKSVVKRPREVGTTAVAKRNENHLVLFRLFLILYHMGKWFKILQNNGVSREEETPLESIELLD